MVSGITLESLILLRLNEVHSALLQSNYDYALNALRLVWSLIPDENMRKMINDRLTEHQKRWKQLESEIRKEVNKKELDNATASWKLNNARIQYQIEMTNDMTEFTTRLLIENNMIAREPSV